MNFSDAIEIKNNKKEFIKMCEQHMDEFEEKVYKAKTNIVPAWSCKDTLLKIVSNTLKQADRQFLTNTPWNTNYKLFSLTFLYNTAFDLAISGQFHIFRGMLTDEGKSLKAFIHFCMPKLVEFGDFTEEEAKEQLSIVEEDIASVG